MPQCLPAGSNPSMASAHPKVQGQWVHAVLWLPFAPGAQPTGPPPPWIFAPPPPAPPRAREESSESSEDRRQKFIFSTVNILKILHVRRIQKMTRKEPTRDDLKLLRKQAARCLLSKTYTNQHIYFGSVLPAGGHGPTGARPKASSLDLSHACAVAGLSSGSRPESRPSPAPPVPDDAARRAFQHMMEFMQKEMNWTPGASVWCHVSCYFCGPVRHSTQNCLLISFSLFFTLPLKVAVWLPTPNLRLPV